MIEAPRKTGPSLLVFSDDWGRHPSSCQHLVRQLLPHYPVCWVNTIGTRTPKLDLATAKRVAEKLRHWSSRSADDGALPANLRVVNPKMWPWMTRPHDRGVNRRLLVSQLTPIVKSLPQPVIAVTTLPIMAGLVGQLPIARWIYYCVDDFSVWPGLDGETMKEMDVELIHAADERIAVSRTLQTHIEEHGQSAHLLTHGVDLEHWNRPVRDTIPEAFAGLEPPIVLFWGVVDRRMDVAYVNRLAESMTKGTIALVGPKCDLDPELFASQRVVHLPPVAYAELPALAAAAEVLVMPYADLPVTRAMQPLKLKEYLATGKPVVVSKLPSTAEWNRCLDETGTAEEFIRVVESRLANGLPASQRKARSILIDESWEAKAEQFEECLLGDEFLNPHLAAELVRRVAVGDENAPDKSGG